MINQLTCVALNFSCPWMWVLPEFDMWQYWMRESLRSKVLPQFAGC